MGPLTNPVPEPAFDASSQALLTYAQGNQEPPYSWSWGWPCSRSFLRATSGSAMLSPPACTLRVSNRPAECGVSGFTVGVATCSLPFIHYHQQMTSSGHKQ